MLAAAAVLLSGAEAYHGHVVSRPTFSGLSMAAIKPAAPKPVAPKPVAKKPVVAPKPVAKKPVAAKPVAAKPANKPIAKPSSKPAGVSAIKLGDIGTTKPLGVYDPLGLMTKMPDKYRRFQEMEIKHGRMAMAAALHVIVTMTGFRWPGYLSIAEDIKFSDMPGGAIASWAALPNLAWLQIVLVVALLDNSVLAQDPAKAPGDVGDGTFVQPGKIWVRYEDKPGIFGKEYKLNVERNNGRLAMVGFMGMVLHEAAFGNPLYPIPVPPQPVLEVLGDDIEKGPARVGSFVLASLGMAFVGIAAAIPEFNKQQKLA